MTKVSNRGCIRRLGFRSMKAAKTRNIIAILAIALTSMLFTSLFTIVASINYSFQQENFRRVGGDGHGGIKYINYEQVEEFRKDPLIVESWARLFVGMPQDPPFNKAHVEVSYLEPNGASHFFCEPVEGRLPLEGTNEVATDTRVLSLLGVEPKIGAEFTMSFYIDESTSNPTLITRTFKLSGWWEFDNAIVASHILLPRDVAEEICAMSSGDENSMCGIWGLDMMFKSSVNIEGTLETLLQNHGYQGTEPGKEDYLATGVNWGYSGSQLTDSIDPGMVIAIIAIALLIIFTGYLIIYNVFQVSVSNDIQFYGLLKTIGTTGRQIKRIVRQQALILSVIGIPFGLLCGFLLGNKLTPIIMDTLDYKKAFVTFNPWIFLIAALFSLVTVFLSCARPGRMAARVSPVEAVRYTEGSGSRSRNSVRRGSKGVSLLGMAWANIGRSRSKTIVTVISLSLAVVLMTLVYTFTTGFDMDKYLQDSVCDFVFANASYFQTYGNSFFEEREVTEDMISEINTQGGITESGRIYGQIYAAQTFVSEARYRVNWGRHNPEDVVDMLVDREEKMPDGRLATGVTMYGMEDFALSKLKVWEGDIAPLYDPSQNAVAVAYFLNDYGDLTDYEEGFRVGDTVTVRHVDEWETYYTDTGEVLKADEEIAPDRPWNNRPKVYHDIEYKICAVVYVPNSISYRSWTLGNEYFVLGAERFIQDTGTDSVMLYAYDTTDESNAAMEEFVKDYTENAQPLYDYESKATYAAEFDGFKSMFLILGGSLSFIIGLVGLLNFINAVLTGIMTRKREFAVLQSIGLTGKQLKIMLVYEGLFYTMLAILLSLLLSVSLGPLAGTAFENIMWFFSYRFTITPVAVILPLFLLLGALVPLITYRSLSRQTIVERLRAADN